MDWLVLDFIIYFWFPVAIIIVSILSGLLLLRKHFYIKYLPWVMSIVFLLSCFTFLFLYIINDYLNCWILDKLCSQDNFITYLLWGLGCTIASFSFSFITVIFLKIFYKVDYIKYKKCYMKLYIYVTLLPTIIVFYCLPQYNSFSKVLDDFTFHTLYTVLIIVSAVVYTVTKEKTNTKSKIAFCIRIIIHIILFLYLIEKEYKNGVFWQLSYCLASIFCCMIYEVKRSKQEDYPNDKDFKNKKFSLLSYVPIIVMISCCLLISVI